MSGQRGPTIAEQWRRFGEYPPVRRWAARISLIVTAALIFGVLAAVLVLLGRAGVALFIAGWHATGW